jgi:hypothetical protein
MQLRRGGCPRRERNSLQVSLANEWDQVVLIAGKLLGLGSQISDRCFR